MYITYTIPTRKSEARYIYIFDLNHMQYLDFMFFTGLKLQSFSVLLISFKGFLNWEFFWFQLRGFLIGSSFGFIRVS